MQRIYDLSDLSDGIPAFNCASAIGNLWSICLGVNISILLPFYCWSI